MTTKTLLAALALTILPAVSYAFCSERGHQAQSCESGTVWDNNLQACVKQVNT